ncbi:MAG TPA: retention module-containing protein, partial [Paenalcaligenes sp.]|nr:retention module-containing protein [Paenalcaligenes sp.]
MAIDTVLVTNVSGTAWLRQADGSLLPLREGMRVPVNAEIVTDNGSTVQLQGDGMPPLTVGENREFAVSPDLAQDDVDPTEQSVSVQADPDAARVLAALQAGEDPFEVLDPTAAVITGGGDDGGSSFTRLLSIVETTVPLALEYPRPTLPERDIQRLGGRGVNNDPESLVVDGTILAQINDDSEFIEGFDVSQYFFDADNDPLTFNATGLPPGLSIDPNTGIISGTIDRSASQGGNNGVYHVVVTATDPKGGQGNIEFTWTALNPPPVAELDTETTEENTLLEVSKENGLLSNDNDP